MQPHFSIRRIELAREPIHPVRILMILIVTEFVNDIGKYKQATRKPYRQSEQIDERDEFVFHQIAERDLEIVEYHNPMV
jgi:hypothetical protein